LFTSESALTDIQEKSVDEVFTSIDQAVKLINDFLNSDLPEYQKQMAGRMVPAEVFLK